jgi:1-hydroxycarotenoid 3,4-desaturase
MRAKRVIVVGAGVGGLVSSLELASRGVEVLVLERASQVGGKMRQVTLGGAAMDAGPTVFTMRWVFEEMFDSIGLRLADHLTLRPASVLARHAWSGDPGDSQRLDLFADVARSADAIGAFAGPCASRGYLDFCERARRIYRTLEAPFLRGTRPNPISLASRVGLHGLPELMRISPFATMWSELGRYFADPRLQQLFGRYATYCGSSPFLAPATLMLVAHVEQDGVWLVEGGMHHVARTLAQLARQRGATLRFDAQVDQIMTRDGRACGVRLAGGEELQADAIVFNGDVAALAAGRLGDAALTAAARVWPARRSLSALTWNLLAPTRGFPLSRHTVFFSNDSAREFGDLFKRNRLPESPTVYVCAQDRADDDIAHEADGCSASAAERLLMIVNAPATGDTRPFTPEELARCETQTFRSMARCGLEVQRHPDCTLMTTPQDFERLFPATGGALYGQASHGWAASFRRPGARSKMPGLYLAGGSVHPGPGVPMAVLSGRQAAASVLADRSSHSAAMEPSASGRSPRPLTSTSHPTATPGGTSTH